MKNPWEEISLTDYENHMKLDSIRQLQALNEMMKGQFDTYPASSVMILGIAGGNGLNHIRKGKFKRIYGVDINSSYLQCVKQRYPDLDGLLDCLCIDLMNETDKLPKADMVIADLLIEYIGYDCFQNAIRQVKPNYVSCIIQINIANGWVSDSPFHHAFDGLERIHHQMDGRTLKKAMSEIDYLAAGTLEQTLPDGKKLVRMDFEKQRGLRQRTGTFSSEINKKGGLIDRL